MSNKEKISFSKLAALHHNLFGFDDPYLVERVYQCLKCITPHISPSENLKIADFGCGDFRATRLIRIQIPNITNFYCVDVCPKSEDIDADFTVIPHDLNNENLSIASDSVDFVYSLEVIEHLWNCDAFISNIRRILKSKGFLLITTPNFTAWYNRLLVPLGVLPVHYEVSFNKKYGRVLKPLGEGGKPAGHIRLFTPFALSRLLEDNGFKILNCKGLQFLYSHYASALDRLFTIFPSMSSAFLIFARKR